jgi:aconitate hydratase 2/2-methylisocitrate dehydratase
VLEAYRQHVAERAAQGVPPKPLDEKQVADLVALLKNPPKGEEAFLVDLLENRVPAGVDPAAYVKAAFLAAVTKGEATSSLVTKERAVYLLGTMLGGYNVEPLIALLSDAALGALAAEALKKTLLVFDSFHDVEELAKAGNANAKAVLQSWADAEWFTSRKDVPTEIKLTVFKVTGETNTDDLSPAQDAWSRPDIPLHANAMLKNVRDGINPEKPQEIGPLKQIEALKAKGNPVAYVGDVVGTGSSRKSATNSVLWFTATTFRTSPTSVKAACVSVPRSPPFSSTPWKMLAPCRSSWT